MWDAGVASFPGTLAIAAGTGPFTVTGSNLPTGLTAVVNSRTISFTGTPTVANVYSSASVTIRDAAGATVTKTFSITINPALTFTSSLPQGTSGANYNQTITVTGGTGSFTNVALTAFSAGTTGLPGTAFTRNIAAGTITINGMPTNGGTIIITAIAVDSLGISVVKTYKVTVNAVPYLTALTQTQWTQNVKAWLHRHDEHRCRRHQCRSRSSVPAGCRPAWSRYLSSGRTRQLHGHAERGRLLRLVQRHDRGHERGQGDQDFQHHDQSAAGNHDAHFAEMEQFRVLHGNRQELLAGRAAVHLRGHARQNAGGLDPQQDRQDHTGLSHAMGTFTFTITATDATGATSSEIYTIWLPSP